ncbi:unnamed protein product [Choristocarpus tenellus]
MAWHDFGSHHTQSSKVDVVLWGIPDCSLAIGIGGKLDVEELTRDRRRTTPLIQQCDVIFPLLESDTVTGSRVEETDEHRSKEESNALLVLKRNLREYFYYRVRGGLASLLEENFLRSHVLSSCFCAVALNAASDHGNSFAILPRGRLILFLDRESFQAMGLPGEAAPSRPRGTSKYTGGGPDRGDSRGWSSKRACNRYLSIIDLSAKSFRPGKPLRERVLSCLAQGRVPDADMAVCWWEDDQDGDMTRGGRQRYSSAVGCVVEDGEAVLGGRDGRTDVGNGGNGTGKDSGGGAKCLQVQFPVGFLAQKVEVEPEVTFFRDVCCPNLDFVGKGLLPRPHSSAGGEQKSTPEAGKGDNALGQHSEDRRGEGQQVLQMGQGSTKTAAATDACSLTYDFFEWLGAVSCGVEGPLQRAPEVCCSTFQTPKHIPFHTGRTVCRARLRGLLPPLCVRRCLDVASGHQRYGNDELGQFQPPRGDMWGALTTWAFCDGPHAYDTGKCVGFSSTCASLWPVGGEGLNTTVVWPGSGCVAYISAACPGPGN